MEIGEYETECESRLVVYVGERESASGKRC